MSKKSRFREPFGKYHGKQAESLLKSERGHLYHIYWFTMKHIKLENISLMDM